MAGLRGICGDPAPLPGRSHISSFLTGGVAARRHRLPYGAPLARRTQPRQCGCASLRFPSHHFDHRNANQREDSECREPPPSPPDPAQEHDLMPARGNGDTRKHGVDLHRSRGFAVNRDAQLGRQLLRRREEKRRLRLGRHALLRRFVSDEMNGRVGRVTLRRNRRRAGDHRR